MKIFSSSLLIVAISLAFLKQTEALDNGLALTPPMGWLAWERYVCETNCDLYPTECISQSLFEEMATRLVDDGFKLLGYQYINIDDCWSTKKRDNATLKLVPDPKRFPNILRLSEYVHSLGLKLGIYGDCGTDTCQMFPGQLKYQDRLEDNYFDIDAYTFAQWEVDSFKFDGCNMLVKEANNLCPQMGDSLNRTNRPMLFSCSWPAYEYDANIKTNWDLVVEKCNLWRPFGDIEDSWKSVLDTIDLFVKNQDIVLKYHGPGHWFDADQLVIGNFGLSHEQERAQMAIWSIWASPLYMSNDLRNLNKQSATILKNKYLIQVNQDRMGIFGMMVATRREVQVFVKPIEPILNNCPSYAIVYLNRRTLGTGQMHSFKLSELIKEIHGKLIQLKPSNFGVHWSKCAQRIDVSYNVYDLFDSNSRIQSNLNLQIDSLTLKVNPSGVRMVQLIQDK